jgi:hypothetical protein
MNLKTKIISVNLTALRALVVSAYDVDYRQNRIMQEPKLPLYQIRYDHNFRKKQTNQKKMQHSTVIYS